MSPDTIGERLRRAREQAGATLLQASQATKIRPAFLDSMEGDSFAFVSGKTYARGLLLAYARWLRLDAQGIGAEFDRIYGPPTGPSLSEMVPEPAARGPRPPRNQWVVAAALASGLLLLLSLAGLWRPGRNVAEPPPVPATPTRSSVPRPPSVVAEAPVTAPQGPQEGMTLVVYAVGDRSWLRVEVDDNRTKPFQGILAAGSSHSFQAKSAIRVTIGNLTAVRLEMNGRDLGRPGAPGQTVGTFTFTPDSLPFAPS